MINRIIRLVTPDSLGAPYPVDTVRDTLTVIREEYSEELMAYFVRSRIGILLVVNSLYAIQDQAKAISIIKNEISKCSTSEAGVLAKGFKYKCGGKCCNKEKDTIII